MNVIICDAVRARRLLRFFYDGYERIVEPHVYGLNSAGHEAVRGWLARGWSKSGEEPGWRMFLVSEMRDVAAMVEAFPAPRAGYNPEDTQFREVYCRVEPEERGEPLMRASK